MIFYIFNNYFPDNTGFVNRCTNEINALAKIETIFIICRGNDKKTDITTYKCAGKKISISRFYPSVSLTERPKIYIPIVYELIRNFSLIYAISIALVKSFWKFRKEKNKKIYAVSSPLTVPLIAMLLGYIFSIKNSVIEFHDLEPELAAHIKSFGNKGIVYKIELLLEKILVKVYKKVIVTSTEQAKRLISRTGIDKKNIVCIPNSVNLKNNGQRVDLKKMLKISKNDFILGYFSSFSYDYTITGIIEIINSFSKFKKNIKNLRLLLVGDGDGLQKIKNAAKNNPNIIFTGKVLNVDDYLQIIDCGIIPWHKNEMTETILPTKLFSYMASKKPVVAPSFGEFKNILKDKFDSLLYRNNPELIQKLTFLSRNKQKGKTLSNNAYIKYIKYFAFDKHERSLLQAII